MFLIQPVTLGKFCILQFSNTNEHARCCPFCPWQESAYLLHDQTKKNQGLNESICTSTLPTSRPTHPNKLHYTHTNYIISMALNFVLLIPNSLGALGLVPPFLVIPVPCLNCELGTMRFLQLMMQLI